MKKLIILLVLLVVSCSDKDFFVTESNMPQLLEELDNKNLTSEEKELFRSYILKAKVKNIFIGKAIPIEGKISDIVQKERQDRVKLEAEKAEAEKIKKQLYDEYIATKTLIDSSLEGVVTSIGAKRVNYLDSFYMEVYVKNKSTKNLKAFKGMLEFRNSFNEIAYRTTIASEQLLPAGEGKIIFFSSMYNRFEHDQLINAGSNAKTNIIFYHLVYEDNQEVKFDPSSIPQF